ncbi:MAG: hypothetical protein WAW79_13085 [Steroidobacteraceae bacterium]
MPRPSAPRLAVDVIIELEDRPGRLPGVIWAPLGDPRAAPPLAFDHGRILADYLQQLEFPP